MNKRRINNTLDDWTGRDLSSWCITNKNQQRNHLSTHCIRSWYFDEHLQCKRTGFKGQVKCIKKWCRFILMGMIDNGQWCLVVVLVTRTPTLKVNFYVKECCTEKFWFCTARDVRTAWKTLAGLVTPWRDSCAWTKHYSLWDFLEKDFLGKKTEMMSDLFKIGNELHFVWGLTCQKLKTSKNSGLLDSEVVFRSPRPST